MPNFFPEGDLALPTDSVERSMAKVVSQLPAALDKLAIDPDAAAYIALSGATDVSGIDAFVKGIKALGLWNSMVCWPLRSSQNVGTGTTVYSLGGLGAFNGTLVNGPPWSADGIDFFDQNRINKRMQTSFSFLQPATIFSVFTRGNVSIIQRVYGPPAPQISLLRGSSGTIIASAGDSVSTGTISLANSDKFYTSQVEFNGANSTSSFNGSSKTQIDLGLNNNSGFIIGAPDGSRGALTSFVGVFSTTSMDLIHNLYLETLGEGLPLP